MARYIRLRSALLGISSAWLALSLPGRAQCGVLKVLSDNVSETRFGTSVAVSGVRMVVGAPYDSEKGLLAGSAWVFERVHEVWVNRGELLPNGSLDFVYFGTAVGIDKKTIVIGAPGDFVDRGSAYVFERTGTQWKPTSKQVDLSGGKAKFGTSVTVDEKRFAVGAPDAGRGAAYIYAKVANQWSLEDKVTTDDTCVERFGRAVALCGDTLLVSTESGCNYTYVYVFERQGSEWVQTDRLEGLRFFGWSLSMREDVALISVPNQTGSGAAAGEVHVFRRRAGSWALEDTLKPSDGEPGDYFGSSVSIGDGFAVVGTPWANSAKGKAYTFVHDGTSWAERAVLQRTGAEQKQFGNSVSASGGTFAVGAPFHLENGKAHGATFVYPATAVSFPDEHSEPLAYCTGKTNSLGCRPKIRWWGCPSAEMIFGFTIAAESVRNKRSGALLYGITGPAETPFAGGTLCINPPVYRCAALNSGGHLPPIQDCSGRYRLDMNAFAAGMSGNQPRPELRVPGQGVHAQWWARDPGDPYELSLSDALEFVVGP